MSWRLASRLVVIAAGFVTLVPRTALAVDGTILIDQNRALAGNVTPGDTPGFPVTISRSGSYRLSGNLDAPEATEGIRITASRVTLDLNGFTLRLTGDAGFAFGILAFGDDTTVSNGVVTGFAGGVLLPGAGARIERVHAVGMPNGFGIVGGPGSIVRGNVVRGNHIGIEVRGKGLIADNTVIDNENFGIIASGQDNVPGGSTIINNSVAGNGNVGIQAVCPSTLMGNTVVHNVSVNVMLINAASCLAINNLAP